MRKIFGILCVCFLLMSHVDGAEAVQPIYGISPPYDAVDDLGEATLRWNNIYTLGISDGNVRVTPQDLWNLVEGSEANRDHNALSEESRSSLNQHPITSITGLQNTLDTKAGKNEATQAVAGLMSPQDKALIDNASFDTVVHYTDTGNIRLPSNTALTSITSGSVENNLIRMQGDTIVVGNSTIPLSISSAGRPTVTLSSSLENIAFLSDLENYVDYDESGNISFPAGTDLNVAIPQPDGSTLLRPLLDTDSAGNFIVGHVDGQVNFFASQKPTVTVGTAQPDAIVLESEMNAKADLVGGKVPEAQLPQKNPTWNVPDSADLVTLTDAVVDDNAYITGGANAGHLYTLLRLPPTVLDNWYDISNSSAVMSVAGKTGAVELVTTDITDLESTYARLASPSFTGEPTAPTPPTTATGDEIMTAAGLRTMLVSNLGGTTPLMDGMGNAGAQTTVSRSDHRHPSDNTRAPINNPNFTGTATGATAAPGTNTAQLATTAFVHAAITNIPQPVVESTWIYPNGGSMGAEGLLERESTFRMPNPYPGFKVKTILQIKVSGYWGDVTAINYTGAGYVGGYVGQDDEQIVIRGPRNYIALNGFDGNINYPRDPDANITSAPCRVYVEKGGPLP